MTRIPPVAPTTAVFLDTAPHRGPVEEAPGHVTTDPIIRITEALAKGEITGDEAVQRLMDGNVRRRPAGYGG